MKIALFLFLSLSGLHSCNSIVNQAAHRDLADVNSINTQSVTTMDESTLELKPCSHPLLVMAHETVQNILGKKTYYKINVNAVKDFIEFL